MYLNPKLQPNPLDIVFLTLPRLELRAPITAPAILKSSVEKHGFTSKCLDLNVDLWHQLDSKKFGHLWFDTDLTFRRLELFEKFWNEQLKTIALQWIERIKEVEPKWVGMTVFSQRSKWISIFFCELLKEKIPHISIVLGGPFTEYVGPDLLKRKVIKAYVIGEGENAIVDLLNGDTSAPGINGLPAKQIENLDDIPIPNYDDFDFSKYPTTWSDPRVRNPDQMGSEFIYITGSRGCVRKCDFCDIQSIWPKFRFRSGENIAEEMRLQNQKYGSRRFLFTDSLLNGSIKQLRDLCTTLIDFRDSGKMSPVKWQGQFIARPQRFMKENDYRLMREAGCFFVSIGVESGSEKVRMHMNKKFSNEDLDFTFQSCAKYGIEMAWLMIVGHPMETEEDFQETLQLLEKYSWINDKGLVRSVALGPTLDIVPGSPLFGRQKELGIHWDEQHNWVYKDNNRATRIERWLRLKDRCQQLNYPIVEKATEHLLKELEVYKKNGLVLKENHGKYKDNFGSVDRTS